MKDELDPKGLIREAYRIDGISAPECRSIFLDWALGVPLGADPREKVRALLARHADEAGDHPMTLTLKAALEEGSGPRRRGGRADGCRLSPWPRPRGRRHQVWSWQTSRG